ncbi:MAG: GNAT family N-acetyltransferase [Oscillospiraceae bacterium]|nr:GNAT family N-acetyltransferase [Oscillospiraceae bacterium]
MKKHEMLNIVQSQLALDLNCTVDDLNGEKDSFVFVETKDNPGRRPFPRNEQHFEMVTMGRAIVVSATPKIIDIVKPILENEKNRDNAFGMPFVCGHGIYYLPDLSRIKPLPPPVGFDYEVVEKDKIAELYQHDGFTNAIQYDINHPRSDELVVLAKSGGAVVGIAGCSNDCPMMWQVGMDVLPEFRNHGLAAYLVNRLTHEILERGFVPYYGTASSNIVSQKVAHRAGYEPTWMCVWKGRFENLELKPTS